MLVYYFMEFSKAGDPSNTNIFWGMVNVGNVYCDAPQLFKMLMSHRCENSDLNVHKDEYMPWDKHVSAIVWHSNSYLNEQVDEGMISEYHQITLYVDSTL